MKHLLSRFTPNMRSSAIYYAGNFGNNILRYLFHLVLLRLFVPAQYGEFLSYLSFIYLLGVPVGTLATVITQKVSEFRGKEDTESIRSFFFFLIKTFTPYAVFFSALFIAFAKPLSVILKADRNAFIILGISVFLSLFQTIINSFSIALQQFIFQTVVGAVGVVFTILFSVGLIRSGLGATGAVIGQLAGSLIPVIITYFYNRRFFQKAKTHKRSFSLGSFIGFSFIFTLGCMSLISTDILMIRSLYSEHLSGLYSSLSMMGKMILFGLSPFSVIVLPFASHKVAQKGSVKPMFLKLTAVFLLFGFFAVAVFSLFPYKILSLFSGTGYLEAAPLLWVVSLSYFFIALSQYLLSFLIALGHQRATLFLGLATLIQPILFILTRANFESSLLVNLTLQTLLVAVLVELVRRHLIRHA